MKTVGERLKQVRKRHRWTLKELSEKSDVSIPYLSDIECERVNPSVKVLLRIAKAYRLTLSNLLMFVTKENNNVRVKD